MTDEHDIDPGLAAEMADVAARRNGHQDEDPDERYRMTDQGMTNYLVDHFGQDMIFVDGVEWLTWDGKTWVPNGKERHTVRGYYEQSVIARRDRLMLDGADPDVLNRFAKSYETNNRALSILQQAQKDCLHHVDELDAESDLFNCNNGVVNLRTGELMEHRREHLLTRVSPTDYVEWDDLPQDDRDRFMRYLSTACEEDDTLMRLCCRSAGYSLTGHTKEEVFFLLWGTTRSGKSTLTEGLASVLGGGYAASMEAAVLMNSEKAKGNVHDMMARVAAARMVNCAEPSRGERFAEGLIKMITSGDKITAAFKFRTAFEFVPRWKVWLSTNHAPGSSDIAVFKRIVIIPFRNTIPDHEIDRTLKPWIKDPNTGGKVLLSWAVEGAKRWYEDGLRYQDVKIVEEWTDKYIDDQDPVGRFLRECTTADRNLPWEHWPVVRELYDAYCAWHWREVGHKVMGLHAFNAAIEERGVVRKRPDPRGKWLWQYLMINQDLARGGL